MPYLWHLYTKKIPLITTDERNYWKSRKRDSNPRLTHYEWVTLPTELFRHSLFLKSDANVRLYFESPNFWSTFFRRTIEIIFFTNISCFLIETITEKRYLCIPNYDVMKRMHCFEEHKEVKGTCPGLTAQHASLPQRGNNCSSRRFFPFNTSFPQSFHPMCSPICSLQTNHLLPYDRTPGIAFRQAGYFFARPATETWRKGTNCYRIYNYNTYTII